MAKSSSDVDPFDAGENLVFFPCEAKVAFVYISTRITYFFYINSFFFYVFLYKFYIEKSKE